MMRTFTQNSNAAQQTDSPNNAPFERARLTQNPNADSNFHLRRTIGNQAEDRSFKGNAEAEIGRFSHDFSRIPIRPFDSVDRQTGSMAAAPGKIEMRKAGGKNRETPRVLALPLQRSCACGGTCPTCKSVRGFREPAYNEGPAIGLRAGLHPASARGPRSDGLEDAPYRGPDESAANALRGPGTGTGMGCVFGPLRVVNSGALEGGYTVNDYLSGGLTWGPVGSPGSAGADGRGFKVQLAARFSNDRSLGVSQTLTHGGSNQAFLDGTAAYLGRPAGSVTNGATFNEPVLNASDPYAHTGWELQYGPKAGTGSASLLTFADVPRAGPGEKGYIDFRTCFYSRGGPCQENDTCRTWRWTIDFTGSNNTNTVT